MKSSDAVACDSEEGELSLGAVYVPTLSPLILMSTCRNDCIETLKVVNGNSMSYETKKIGQSASYTVQDNDDVQGENYSYSYFGKTVIQS